MALADPYSAAAAAAYAFAQSPGPAAIAGPAATADNWSYLLHRYQQQPQFGLPCNPLARYLPTIAPCPTDFLSHTRTRATISLDELPASAPSTSAISNSSDGSSNNTPRDTCSTMHGDRNPLALAASEAAAATSSSSSAASSTPASPKTSSTQHKMSETGSAVVSMASNHSILFPFPSAAPSLNMAAAAAAYANRCLSGNCSCTAGGGGQSSPTCPKNVQAGPLTGISIDGVSLLFII